jgi:lysophospholipase L1-like esterase
MRRHHFARWGALLVSVVGLVAFLPSPAGAATGIYVALGDSYTAGPLVPSQILSAKGCLRSDHNYAHIVAAGIGASALRDASCSGATTANMTGAQGVVGRTNPPQFNSLSSATSIVTLGIGGNDIGFTSIILNCASIVWWGSPCHNKYVTNGDDKISDSINRAASKIAAAIDGIHARAPHARVFVVGYPAILPNSGGGCWPTMPITSNDVPYLRTKEKQLNSTIAAQAAAHHAKYVDVYTPSIGHDACSGYSTRWVEPVVPLHLAAPVHPNATGEQGMANAVRAAIGP